MSKPKYSLQEHDLDKIGPEDKVNATLEPRDASLSHFAIEIELEGETVRLASKRKKERKFSAAAALRYTRDQLGLDSVTVKLTQKERGEQEDER
jgi:hypothetical protein